MMLVDYESEFRKENLIDYLNYLCRILKIYYKKWKELKIRIIILYTSDVERADALLDIGCLKFTIEQAFLTTLDTEQILKNLGEKINDGKPLNEREQMELIILPLTVKGNVKKQTLLVTVVELARKLSDETCRTFVLAGILTFSDKIINNELADSIRREIHMLKVEKIIFEEGLEAGLIQGEQDTKKKFVIKMLKCGLSIEEISKYTELSLDTIVDLKKQIPISL